MAGMFLNGNLGVAPSAATGSPPPTIASQAYGINSGLGNGDGGPKTAAFGTAGIGVGAALLLVFLWYSLPR